MSPTDLDRLLHSFRPDRRAFLRSLAMGTAYVAPVVSSFSMDGLVRAAAGTPGVSNLCSNITASNLTNLVVTKTIGQNPAVAGENVTYTLTVANCSTQPASGVQFTDRISLGATFVSATQISGTPTFDLPLPPAGENILTGTAQDVLDPFAQVVFEIVVHVPQ